MPAGSRVAALCAATLVTGAFTFGSGVAIAADKPIAGSDACTQQVEATTSVKNARAAVAAAQEKLAADENAGASTEQLNLDRVDLNSKSNTLRIVVRNTTDLLCRDADTTTPPVTTEPAPVSNGDRTFAEARRLIATLECDDDFVSDQARIASLRTAAGNGLSQTQQNRLTDLLNSRLDALRDCEPADPQPTTVTVPPATSTPPSVVGGAQVDQNVTVNPTQDDGSVADTDGSQIEVVPDGSASTGAA